MTSRAKIQKRNLMKRGTLKMKRSACCWLVGHPVGQAALVFVSLQAFFLETSVDSQVMVTLAACFWQTSSYICELLGHRPDMVGFKATAASDVSHTKFKSLASPFPGFPASDLPGFDAEGKLWNLDPAKAASVRHPVTQRLGHQVGGQLESVQGHLHRLQHFQADERVKEAVDSDEERSSLGHLTAHSPTPTPDSSPTGPMHIVA